MAAVPNNASLAYAVADKDLKSQKKHLEHVPLDKAPTTVSGGVHVGPDPKKQADFPPNEVGIRSELATQHEQEVHRQSGTSVIGATAQGGNAYSAASSGEVSVQSSVVMDTTQTQNTQAPAQIQSLLSRLSSTTAQVNEYSRRKTDQISKEANDRIQVIIAETQREQDALLHDASARSLEIEGEYASKLKAFLQELDASKAGNLAALEKDLNFRQEQLLNNARDEMDSIHAAATKAKIAAMADADRAVHKDVDALTEQVKALGEAEVERRMNSTTTTTIVTTTQAESTSTIAEKQLDEAKTNESIRSHTITTTGEPRTQQRI